MKKNILKCIFTFCILIISIVILKENLNNRSQNNNIRNRIIREDFNTYLNNTQEVIIENDIPKELKGYEVIAKLEIPKIELTTYVLKENTESSLKVSVTKFWGADPNEVGNFCIAGHNFVRDNMFKNIHKLSIGDTIFLTNMLGQKREYKVYDNFTVLPNETSILSQETNDKREITLITCTLDSLKRIIIKAVEV